jgi:thiosulfate/3-mercaptopyruvate sulfurtransferase
MSLITAQELAARLDDPAIRIVDVRWALGAPDAGRERYAEAHIPGAIFLDLETDLSDPAVEDRGRHPLPDPRAFAERLGRAGIGDEHFVVAYDDAGGTVAARLWWMLDDLGHAAVAVLDGGVDAWLAAGLPVTTAVPEPPAAALHLRDRWTRVTDRPALKARLGSVVLLDGRAPERYRGETEPVDPVAGHIPTARSGPVLDNLGGAGTFLEPGALRARFADLGAAGKAEVVTSCGSGVNACHHALAMRVAGLPAPILYEGSYSDWSRAGEPVATGPEPGEAPQPH